MKLSLPQQDIYFEQLLYANDPIYNIGAKVLIEGPIDFDIFNKAYIALIDQHDSYRSIIVKEENEVKVEILPSHNSQLAFVDFSEKKDADLLANNFMQEEFIKPFHLDSDKKLYKFILVKVHQTRHHLFSVCHHILTDGWGTSIMFQRFVKNYNELFEHGKIISNYPYSYTDFVKDDLLYHNSDAYLADKAYWTNLFKVHPERLFYKKRPNIQLNKSSRKELVVKRSQYNELSVVAKECKGSTFHLILALLYLYFGRKQQNNDFAIGLPVLNRSNAAYKKTVGLFMGVTALRIQTNFSETLEDLVGKIRQQLRQDYRHQRFPLGKLIQELNVFGQTSELFNITLSYEKQNYSDHFIQTKSRVVPLTHESERVALAIYIREFDELEDVKIDFDYNLNYFNQDAIHEVVTHFGKLMESVCSLRGQKRLVDYTFITQRESTQLLSTFNKTQFDYPKDVSLLHFFEKQVQQSAQNKVALRDHTVSYTYKELDEISGKLATYLTKNSGGDKSPVGVLMERSAHLIVVLLGVLKSGRAYIPLDPSFPQERLKYIIAHSEVTFIIDSGATATTSFTNLTCINAQRLLREVSTYKAQERVVNKARDMAYIIYTSGSTGKPKGVMVPHRALLNFLLSIKDQPGITSHDVLYSVTTQSFDISILEFFAPLIAGATLYIETKEVLSNPLRIVEELKRVQPTIIQATPSFFQLLFNANWSGDKGLKVLCGGDLLSKQLAQKLIENSAQVWNMYGPTETTIWSSIKRIVEPKDASIIGKPIYNTQFYILDQYLQLLPIGSEGDIYIGGDGLSQGYVNNKQLTAEVFLKNPFNESEKIYRTGDVGRWNKQGEIEFLGRNDHQVKIRGYRIELEEIETALNSLPMIETAIVVAKKNEEQEAFLVAFVATLDQTIDTPKTVALLRKQLPEYMIPYIIVPVKEFPLTPNKKVDRQSLAAYQITKNKSISKKPTSPLEVALAKFYREVLHLKEEVAVGDNFFELGGHSLNAVKLISWIDSKLKYQLTLKDIFDYPTIASLSQYIEKHIGKKQKPIRAVKISEDYTVTYSQYAIWLASQKRERSIAYNMFAAFEINGTLSIETLRVAFNKIIKRHEVIRTNFVEVNGFPRQKITSVENLNFTIDLLKATKDIEGLVEEYVHKEFNLEKELLLRVGLVTGSNNKQLLVFCTHHIIMDGLSMEILLNELTLPFQINTLHAETNLKALKFQYKDYAVWNNHITKNRKEDNAAFWNKYLKGCRWSLPNLQQTTTLSSENLNVELDFVWDEELYMKLQTFLKENKVTLHNVLITAFNVLLYKLYDLNDICIGTMNTGRNHPSLYNLIGMFAKTLPLRTKIHPSLSLLKEIDHVQRDLLLVDAHQDIPQTLQDSLRIEILIALQNPSFSLGNIRLNQEVSLRQAKLKSLYNRLPLLINFSEQDYCLHCNIHANPSKFNTETVNFIMLKFQKLIEELIANPTTAIRDIDLALPFEKEDAIDIDFNF